MSDVVEPSVAAPAAGPEEAADRSAVGETPGVRRALGYLLGMLASAVATVLGLPLLCVPALATRWARWHRRRAAVLLRVPELAAGPGPVARQALLWLPAHAVTGAVFGLFGLLVAGNVVVALIATPLWWAFDAPDRPRLFVEVPVTGWTTALLLGPLQVLVCAVLARLGFGRFAAAHARLSLTGLAPSAAAERLARRVAVLARTRADVLDAHNAELRRIERDLHDGTQARLVAIAVRLAVARESLATGRDDPALVDRLLREAHEGTEEAMTELREVIRSVYPAILDDRGLAGALDAVAARCPIPVRLDAGELGQVPTAVAAVVYFAVAEALTNVARHSGAAEAHVRVRRDLDRLSVTVTDDGAGGADPGRGTGLAGVARRAHALDGDLEVTSPPGGPTVVRLELPCG